MPTKGEIRLAALTRRDAIASDERSAAAEIIAARGLPFDLAPAAVVSGYSPIRNELDPGPLLRKLARLGARLALPAIVGRGQSLIFRAWAPGDRLIMGTLGIQEPSPAAPEVLPDIMLVPLAAFDCLGHRIGYGAGHYDVTFARLRKLKPVIGVGLAFAVQQTEAVPALSHDVALDYVLTEIETFECRSG